MSILNVNTIQPVGSGQTITVSAANISAPSTVVTASSFVGNVTGNLTGNVTGISTLGVTTAYISQLAGVGAGTSIQIPSGSKLVGLTTGSVYAPGSIIQVVQTVYKGTQSITTNLDGFTSVSGLDCIITPTSTSSKILVKIVLHAGIYYYQFKGRITRNSTAISDAQGTVQGARGTSTFSSYHYNAGNNDDYHLRTIYSEYLDSPSSTSALTYGVTVGGYNNGFPVYVNRTNAFPAASAEGYDFIPISTMTLFEISA